MKNTKRFLSNLGIVAAKPKLFPRLLKNYFFLASGKSVLRTIEMALTYDCQCHCLHCSSEGMKDKSKKELTISETKNLINQAVKQGAIHILFTGGETLLAKDKLLELIRYANKRGSITSLDTNGILLDKQYTKELKKAGLDVACISLDSLNPKKHDFFRKHKGCFEKSIRAIKNCRQQKINVIISTLITKENLYSNELFQILKFAKKQNSSIIFCLPILTGRWKGKSQHQLNKQDFKQLNKIMKHPLARLCEENNYFFKGCAAGSEKIAVSLYGDVMPCSFIKEAYGNIRKESLARILKKMRTNPYYRKVNRNIKCIAAER